MAKKHRADANRPSPSTYKARLHDAATAKKSGYLGAYVPLRPVNAAKLIREISGGAK